MPEEQIWNGIPVVFDDDGDFVDDRSYFFAPPNFEIALPLIPKGDGTHEAGTPKIVWPKKGA